MTHGNFLANILCQCPMVPVPMRRWATELCVSYAFRKIFLCRCRHVGQYVMPTWRRTSGKNGKAATLPSYITYVLMPACWRICYAKVEMHRWQKWKRHRTNCPFIHDLCADAGMSATMKCQPGDAPVVKI